MFLHSLCSYLDFQTKFKLYFYLKRTLDHLATVRFSFLLAHVWMDWHEEHYSLSPLLSKPLTPIFLNWILLDSLLKAAVMPFWCIISNHTLSFHSISYVFITFSILKLQPIILKIIRNKGLICFFYMCYEST